MTKKYQMNEFETSALAVPEQVSVAMNEIVADLREGLLALAVGAGLQPLRGSYFHGDGAALAAAAYLVTPWLSWVPNLIIGEAIVARLRATHPISAARPPAPTLTRQVRDTPA